jgi:hypothetical protein
MPVPQHVTPRSLPQPQPQAHGNQPPQHRDHPKKDDKNH